MARIIKTIILLLLLLLSLLHIDVLFLTHRGNFPSSLNQSYIQSCHYDPVDNPFCPVFKVGDILRHINQSLDSIVEKVGPLSFTSHLTTRPIFSLSKRSISLFWKTMHSISQLTAAGLLEKKLWCWLVWCVTQQQL